MSTTETGHRAEAVAGDYLVKLGYKILARNWRTRWCEIDIVATKSADVLFVEVKYRQHNWQGSGLDYITAKKLQQMQFAAELWVSQRRWRGPYRLAAIEVSGDEFAVTDFIDELTA